MFFSTFPGEKNPIPWKNLESSLYHALCSILGQAGSCLWLTLRWHP